MSCLYQGLDFDASKAVQRSRLNCFRTTVKHIRSRGVHHGALIGVGSRPTKIRTFQVEAPRSWEVISTNSSSAYVRFEARTSVGRSRNMGSTCLDTTRLLLHSLMEKRKEPGSKDKTPAVTMMSFSMRRRCHLFMAQAWWYSLPVCGSCRVLNLDAWKKKKCRWLNSRRIVKN